MPNILFDALFAPLAGRQTPLLILADRPTISGDAFLRLVARRPMPCAPLGSGPATGSRCRSPKRPRRWPLYGAAVALGAVFLPLNTAYTADEVDYFLGDATPRSFSVMAPREAALAPLPPATVRTVLTLNADGTGSLAERGGRAGRHDRARRIAGRTIWRRSFTPRAPRGGRRGRC